MVSFRTYVLAVTTFLIPVMPLTAAVAQDVDFETMLKWTAAEVVHYRVVGDYSGEQPITAAGEVGVVGGLMAKVTDHVELEYDWQNLQMKLLGTPIVRNAPTKSEIAYDKRCPAPKVEGAFEFATVTADAQGFTFGGITLSMKRDFVGGMVAYMGEGTCGWSKFTAGSQVLPLKITVPAAGQMAAMKPGASLGEMTMTPDGKSIITQSGGWVWTTTMTIK